MSTTYKIQFTAAFGTVFSCLILLDDYRAFLEYSRAGLQGSKNPLLEEMLLGDLDTSMRRAEYEAVSIRGKTNG